MICSVSRGGQLVVTHVRLNARPFPVLPRRAAGRYNGPARQQGHQQVHLLHLPQEWPHGERAHDAVEAGDGQFGRPPESGKRNDEEGVTCLILDNYAPISHRTVFFSLSFFLSLSLEKL